MNMSLDSPNSFMKQRSTTIVPLRISSDITVRRQKEKLIANPCDDQNSDLINFDDEKFTYPLGFRPRSIDVILGRGVNSYHHIGNEMLRHIVAARIDAYAAAKDREGKSSILLSVVAHVHKEGGAFLKKDRKAGLWVVAERHLIRNKISQIFRTALFETGRHVTRRMQQEQTKDIMRQRQHSKILRKQQRKDEDDKVNLTVANNNNMFDPVKISSMEIKPTNDSFSENLLSLDLSPLLQEDKELCDFYGTYNSALFEHDEFFDHDGDQYENLFD